MENGGVFYDTPSLEEIIDTISNENTFNTTFVINFLKVYRLFTTPHDVLDILIKRFTQTDELKVASDILMEPEKMRIYNVMKLWVENHGYDFKRDQLLLKKMILFAEGTLEFYNNLLSQQIKAILSRQSTGSIKISKTNTRMQLGTPSSTINFASLSVEQISRQYAIILHSVFSKILPYELLCNNREGSSNLNQYLSLLERISNNIEVELNRCNRSDLPKVVEKWIEVAHNSNTINNWQVSSIVVKLLGRLDRDTFRDVWNELKPHNLAVFREIMNLSENPNLLKKTYTNTFPPGIPVIEVIIQEIHSVEKKYLDEIREHKSLSLYNDIYKISHIVESYQQVKYSYHEDLPVQKWLSHEYTWEELENLKLENRLKRDDNLNNLYLTFNKQCKFSNGSVSKEDILNLLRYSNEFQSKFSGVINEIIKEYVTSFKRAIASALKENTTVLSRLRQIQRDVFAGYKFSQWKYADTDCTMYGIPVEVEIDIIQHNQGVYLCDIREEADITRIAYLRDIGYLYRKLYPNTHVDLVIIAKNATNQAIALSRRLMVRLIVDNGQS